MDKLHVCPNSHFQAHYQSIRAQGGMGRNRVGVESDKNGKEQKEDETEVRQVEEESIEEETDPRDDGSSFSTSSPRVL